MPDVIKCPKCKGNVTVYAEHHGKTIACPHCGQHLGIQAPEEGPKRLSVNRTKAADSVSDIPAPQPDPPDSIAYHINEVHLLLAKQNQLHVEQNLMLRDIRVILVVSFFIPLVLAFFFVLSRYSH